MSRVTPPHTRLRKLQLQGFRSIRSAELEFGDLNVLVGANGAGKSNLIAFFKLLNEMMGQRLQNHVATTGRAGSLLHQGPKVTPQLEMHFDFQNNDYENDYQARLFFAAPDTVIFAQESLKWRQPGDKGWKTQELPAGRAESSLSTSNPVHKSFRYLLSQCRVYHFHDTSSSAGVRRYTYLNDKWPLMPHADNLAAFLYHLRESENHAYQRILSTIRLVAPFFDDFVLEPEDRAGDRDILLNWRQRGVEQLFGPHQLSDGTLRAICLISLLLQPEDKLPRMIIVDEPELGLHPYALEIVASLFQKASYHCQVLVSTQSTEFLDHFDPKNLIVADREGQGSRYRRLEEEELESWLDDYSLGEIWRKNVFGGGPH